MRPTSTLLFGFLLTACAEFNPDLSDIDGKESGSGTYGLETDGETETAKDTEDDSATSTSRGPDSSSTAGGLEESSSGDAESTGSSGTSYDSSSSDTENGAGFCGDGVADDNEDCDGSDLRGTSCESQGYDFGDVSCLQDCTLNTTQCGSGTCNPQPQSGPLSLCQVPMEGGGVCEGGEVCLGDVGQAGVCSPGCSSDVQCAVAGLSGCESVPRCLMQQCVYECGADYQCPNPMSCVFSEVLDTSICM